MAAAFGEDGAPRLGVSFRADDLGRDGVARLRETIALAESIGVSRIAIGDSQWSHFDAAVVAALMAEHSDRATVGISPTNPVTREPSVMASLLAGLDSLSGGRACLVMASGDSAALNAGLRPGRLDEIEEYVACVRDLIRTGRATWRGRGQAVRWHDRAVRPDPPILVLAEGPRTLRLAGRIGDGAVIGAGLSADVAAGALRRVEAGARESGRALAGLDVWWTARPALEATTEEAIEAAKGSVSSAGNHSMRFGFSGKGVPPDLAPRIERFVADYDPRQHQFADGDNVRRMEEEGLTGFFLDRFGIVGSPRDWAARLRELRARGIDSLWLAWGGLQPRHLVMLRDEVLPAL